MSVERCVRLWGYSQHPQWFLEYCSANQALERGCCFQSTDTYFQLRYCRVYKQTNGASRYDTDVVGFMRLADILLRSSGTACTV